MTADGAQTPDRWCEQFSVTVHGPDGWRRDGKSWGEPITEKEFWERVALSSCEMPALRPASVDVSPAPDSPAYEVGQRLIFAEDPNPFTVEAVSVTGRWVACTRGWCQWDIDQAHADGTAEEFDEDMHGGWPALGDCVYSVLDLTRGVRGPDNALGSLGYETREECESALVLFDTEAFGHSLRSRPIPLIVVEVRRG